MEDNSSFWTGFCFGAFAASLIWLLASPSPKELKFESSKPVLPEIVIKQLDGKIDTTFIYHHPEYFKQR